MRYTFLSEIFHVTPQPSYRQPEHCLSRHQSNPVWINGKKINLLSLSVWYLLFKSTEPTNSKCLDIDTAGCQRLLGLNKGMCSDPCVVQACPRTCGKCCKYSINTSVYDAILNNDSYIALIGKRGNQFEQYKFYLAKNNMYWISKLIQLYSFIYIFIYIWKIILRVVLYL